MTAEVKEATEEWLTLEEAALLVDRHPESLRVDAKLKLIELTKKQGVRGRMVRLDRFNLYVKRKHGSRCQPVTPEALAKWREALRA